MSIEVLYPRRTCPCGVAVITEDEALARRAEAEHLSDEQLAILDRVTATGAYTALCPECWAVAKADGRAQP